MPDLTGRGTPESAWSRCSTLAAVPSWHSRPPAGAHLGLFSAISQDSIIFVPLHGIGAAEIPYLCQVTCAVQTDGDAPLSAR